MDKIKKVKIKRADGSISEQVPIGADAVDIDLANGNNLEQELSGYDKVYNTCEEMKQDTKLANGMKTKTLGYYEINDGGAAEYYITNIKQVDQYQEELGEGLYASLIVKDNTINVKTCGIKNDGVTDSSLLLEKVINAFKVGTDAYDQNYFHNFISLYKNANLTLFFPKGEYCLSKTLFIPCYINIDFNQSKIKPSKDGVFTNNYLMSTNSTNCELWNYAYVYLKSYIKNLVIDGNDVENIRGIFIADYRIIENINSINVYNTITYCKSYIDGKYINNLNCHNSKGNDFQINATGAGDNLFFNNLGFDFNSNGLKVVLSHGGVISNVINGTIEIDRCESVTIQNWHCEYGFLVSKNANNLILKDSNIYVNKLTGTPITLFSGDHNVNNNTSFIENVNFIYYSNLSDFNFEINEIDISKYHQSLYINNCSHSYWKKNHSEILLSGISVKGQNKTFLCSGDNNKFYNSDLQYETINYTQNNNYLLFGANETDDNNNTLKNSTYYYKMINFTDLDKKCGKISNEINITKTNSEQAIRLSINGNIGHNTILRIYRGTNSENYNFYVDIPSPKTSNLIDNGVSINGYKWKTNLSSNLATNTIYTIKNFGKFDNKTYKSIGYGYSMPVSGSWQQGDIVLRINPNTNLEIGWICITGGEPGVWIKLPTLK